MVSYRRVDQASSHKPSALLQRRRGFGNNKKTIVHIYGGVANSGEERILSDIVQNSHNEEGFTQVIVDLCRSKEAGRKKGITSSKLAGIEGVKIITVDMPSDSTKENSKKKDDCVSEIQEKLAENNINPDLLMGWAGPGNAYATFLAGKYSSRETPLLLRLSNPRPIEEMPDDERGIIPEMLEILQEGNFSAISLSEEVKEKYAEMGIDRSKVAVIHNGVYTEIFKPAANDQAMEDKTAFRENHNIPDDAKIIGTIARCDRQKGVEEFVNAAIKLHESSEYQNVHFVMVGDYSNPLGKQLKEQIQKSKANGFIHIINEIEDKKELAKIYRALDVFTLASRSEAFGNVIVEAMACKTPVVATNVGMAREMLEGVGILVKAEDADSLVKGWQDSLKMPDDDVRKQRLEEGRARAEAKYSTEVMVGNYIAKWKELLSLNQEQYPVATKANGVIGRS